MIRGEGTALAFEEAGEIESSAIISFQGRISAAADTSVSLSVDAALLEFQDTLDMGVGSSLVIEGAIDILDFQSLDVLTCSRRLAAVFKHASRSFGARARSGASAASPTLRIALILRA